MKVQKYKISIVSYTNTLPFRYGIEQKGIDALFDLQYDIPSVCAQKVIEGKVDMGLIPVAVIPYLKEYLLVGRYCLGSNGRVDTVKLYSQVPLEKIKNVLLDYQSRTSVTLVQVLSKFYWKITPAFEPATEGFETQIEKNTAAVVIGDRCFELNGKYAYEYDLAAEWKNFTNLPFVFAAWISNKKIEDELLNEFEQALSWGVAHTAQAVKEKIEPPRQSLIETYLTERISYDLDADKQRSMEYFLELLKQL